MVNHCEGDVSHLLSSAAVPWLDSFDLIAGEIIFADELLALNKRQQHEKVFFLNLAKKVEFPRLKRAGNLGFQPVEWKEQHEYIPVANAMESLAAFEWAIALKTTDKRSTWTRTPPSRAEEKAQRR
jgi:hypothetical protein